MAVRVNRFIGQFGINETPLTTAIQDGDIVKAEQIIRSNDDPSLLNDGAYGNIPLHLVLTNDDLSPHRRNLRLARLLVEAGADPNLRLVEFGDIDCFSPSPIEELVVYHELLRAHEAGICLALCQELEMYMHFENEEACSTFLTNTVDLEGVQCWLHAEAWPSLLKQTEKLIQIFLDCGGDPNVITTFDHKSLFHWVVEHKNMTLAAQLLATCRVNLNQGDLHGNTPLMDAVLQIDQEDCIALYQSMRATGHHLNINSTNCCGETPLFRASFMGLVELASYFIRDGARTNITVNLSQIPLAFPLGCGLNFQEILQTVPEVITPLLAPLLADAPPLLRHTNVPTWESGSRLHKHHIDKIIAAAVSPLVDLGCLDPSIVANHMNILLDLTNFQHLKEGQILLAELHLPMFGHLTAGLRQLCVRKIFDSIFPDTDNADLGQSFHYYCGKDCEGSLKKKTIETATEALGLPPAITIFFEVEAAKYQVCGAVSELKSLDCDSACSALNLSSIDSNYETSDNRSVLSSHSVFSHSSDSVHIFSSDALSEESSSEIEDLSSGEEVEERSDILSTSSDEAGVVIDRRKITHSEVEHTHNQDLRVVVGTLFEDMLEDSLKLPGISLSSSSAMNTSHSVSSQNLTSGIANNYQNFYQRIEDDYTPSTTSSIHDASSVSDCASLTDLPLPTTPTVSSNFPSHTSPHKD